MSLWFVSVAVLVFHAAPVELRRADEMMSEYKYADARRVLAKARLAKGLDREALLRILQLQGIAAGQLRQSDAAVAAFREMLVLEPTGKLDDEYAPRVMTPFLEAKQAVNQLGHLQFRAAGHGVGATGLVRFSVEVAKDPLKMARSVVFHVQRTSKWDSNRRELEGGRASFEADETEATWWAELLGDNDAQLALVGSEAHPKHTRFSSNGPTAESTPELSAPPLPPSLKDSPRSLPNEPEAADLGLAERRRPSPSSAPAASSLRVASYFVLGGGLVAAGIGAGFGVKSSSEVLQLNQAQPDQNGLITTLTERQAAALAASAERDGMIANVCFASGGALVLGGALMWWFGAPVAVVPSSNGVVVSGRLP